MANPQSTYIELMRQEEISWNMVEELLAEEQEENSAITKALLNDTIEGWRRAAEDAGRQMDLMETCLKGCRPVKQITLPW